MGYSVITDNQLRPPRNPETALACVARRAKKAYPGFSSVVSGRRFYSPALGRWISRDPIGEWGGINLYGFVDNEALARIDLLGLRGLCCWGFGQCHCCCPDNIKITGGKPPKWDGSTHSTKRFYFAFSISGTTIVLEHEKCLTCSYSWKEQEPKESTARDPRNPVPPNWNPVDSGEICAGDTWTDHDTPGMAVGEGVWENRTAKKVLTILLELKADPNCPCEANGKKSAVSKTIKILLESKNGVPVWRTATFDVA